MDEKDSSIPNDWYQKGNADIDTVEILLKYGGNMEIAALHIQQALEKYLKGYLLSKGWKLKRTHDLVELFDCALKYNPDLGDFQNVFEEVTAYYFEARYPVSIDSITKKEVGKRLEQAKEIVKMITK